ncbi:pectate lyase-like adhesive domain-containing protein, partial [Lactobacillus sp. M0396]
MLGKNNYKEQLRKMKMQAKHDRFSIRKLSIGAASVLLGFTFFGLGSKTVKADVVEPSQQVETKTKSGSNDLESNITTSGNKVLTSESDKNGKQNKKSEKSAKLSTFSGLASFLRDRDDVKDSKTVKDQVKKAVKGSDQTVSANHPETDSNNEDVNDTNIVSETNTSNDSKLPESSHDSEIKTIDDDVSNDNQTTETDKIIDVKDKSSFVKDASNGLSFKAYNWNDFQNALYNKDINEILIMNDISAPSNNGNNTFDVPGRDLIIRSNGNSKCTLNFTGFSPKQKSGTSANVVYQNLNLISGDYYGVWSTENINGSYQSTITFKDCTFNGSQMIYAGSNTHIRFTGNNEAHTAKWPNRNDQQLFEFASGRTNDSIEFLDGNFVGSTYGGSIIEMKGNGNSVKINRNATVTLNPVQDYDGNSDTGEWGYPFSAIYMEGNGNVSVSGTLNINIGIDTVRPYQGVRNSGKSRAIYLSAPASTFNILQNGQVNINTNGNITNRNTGNLFYNNGSLTISPKAELNIVGNDMGDYSGTLVYITGSAEVENGGFNISLGKKAGSGAITLLDVKGGTFKVDNPSSFVLDAHNNQNYDTSIIGNNRITVTNVRQELQTITGSKFTLPPFHVLQMQKSGTGVSVNNMEMLDGSKVLTKEQLTEIENDPELKEILNDDRFSAFLDAAKAAVASPGNNLLDKIMKTAFETALSTKDSASYNYVKFVPANPSGYLDIDTDSLVVVQNEDGSKSIKGRVKNYNGSDDGPSKENAFYKYFSKGTDGYIIAKYISSNPKYNGIIQEDKTLKPYVNTNDTFRGDIGDNIKELPSVFTSKINTDGSFEVRIPSDVLANLSKEDKVELTPNANFVGYSPDAIDSGVRPVEKGLEITGESGDLEANKTAQKAYISSMAEAAKKRIQNAYD